MTQQTELFADEQTLTVAEHDELVRLEAAIDRGLKTFYEVGTALAAIRDQRLYRHTHGTFEEYCRERWGMSHQQASRLIGAADVAERLAPMGAKLPANERQTRPLTSLPPEQQQEAWGKAVETAPEGKVTAKHVQQVVNEMLGATDSKIEPEPDDESVSDDEDDLVFADERDGAETDQGDDVQTGQAVATDTTAGEPKASHTMAVMSSSESPEWYTPARVLDLVLQVLGDIDLDPCSNSHEHPNVPARLHYTQQDDGLMRQWRGKVYLNPPYGDTIDDWIQRLLLCHSDGSVPEAIALVPARTDTQWFLRLREYPRCFVTGRLRFVGSENPAPFPSVVFYIGPRTSRFAHVFQELGDIYVRYRPI